MTNLIGFLESLMAIYLPKPLLAPVEITTELVMISLPELLPI